MARAAFKITKIQIFKFRKVKCSSVWRYDKNISTFWQKRTFTKGQLISKGLFGMYPQFFQKTNEKIRLWYLRSTCFRSLFGRIWIHQKDFSKLTDLWQSPDRRSKCLLYDPQIFSISIVNGFLNSFVFEWWIFEIRQHRRHFWHLQQLSNDTKLDF